jgi:hypothetical protein
MQAMGPSRTMQQFLEDQKKKEEERLMKISLKMELSQMKELQEITATPSINSKSKRLIEKKLEHSPRGDATLPQEVYTRLYEIGKHRVQQRN